MLLLYYQIYYQKPRLVKNEHSKAHRKSVPRRVLGVRKQTL